MPFAARLLDDHKCLQFNGNGSPHVGGPITGPGVPTVRIGGGIAAVVGDICICAGTPDTIKKGSSTVKIGGRAAAYQGLDVTEHHGNIVAGCPTVIIGI